MITLCLHFPNYCLIKNYFGNLLSTAKSKVQITYSLVTSCLKDFRKLVWLFSSPNAFQILETSAVLQKGTETNLGQL